MTSARPTKTLEALRTLAPGLPGVLLVLLAAGSFGFILIDDAFISLTYARNLAEGHGLVFHPALPLAEGYSNLLWTLLLAACLALGVPGATAATTLGLVCAATIVVIIAVRLGGWRGVAAGLAVAVSPIFAYWSGRGLETSLASLLLLVGVLNLGRPAGWIALGLLGITRVEGVLYAGLPALFALIGIARGRGWPPSWVWAALFGPAAVQLIVRLTLFGRLLPSTALAKTGHPMSFVLPKGLAWIAAGFELEPVLPLAILAVGGMLALSAWRRQPLPDVAAPWALLAVAGVVAYAVLVGGDWMPNYRWLQAAIPLGWYAVVRLVRHQGIAVGLALVGTLSGLRSPPPSPDSKPREWSLAVHNLWTGAATAVPHRLHVSIVESFEVDAVILLPDIGMMSYMSGNAVLDPQGLTWQAVAEAEHDGWQEGGATEQLESIQQTVYKLRPVVVAVPVRGARSEVTGPVGLALLGGQDQPPPPWFDAEWYLWGQYPYGEEERLLVFLRGDVAAELDPERRVARWEAALERLPESLPVRRRLAAAYRAADMEVEAVEMEASIDPPPGGWRSAAENH